MWTAPRCVKPEWLDVLPPDDLRAAQSRRDLKRVNAWMLQGGIMARSLVKYWGEEPPRTLLDIGSGDGTFLLRVAQRVASRWAGITVYLLDRQDIVSVETRQSFESLHWNVKTVSTDVFEALEQAASADIITANLFLHHFQQAELLHLFKLSSQRTRLFVACEPRRSAPALIASRLLWAIGCNDVSRHDAFVSVRAGFSGEELSPLWPKNDGWELHEQLALPFTHCFAARRTARSAT